MNAKYIKQEISDLNGTGRTQAYYKMKLRPLTNEQFIAICAEGSPLDESTIQSVLTRVSDRMASYMAGGFSVKLDGLGTFHAKLGMRSDMLQDAFEEGEPTHNASAIRVTGVSYRADNDLIRETNLKCTLEKEGVSRLRKCKFTLEKRIQKAKDFLTKNMFMRVPDYMRLTGLSRTTASMELRKLADNPSSGITSRGRRSQKFYVLSEKC